MVGQINNQVPEWIVDDHWRGHWSQESYNYHSQFDINIMFKILVYLNDFNLHSFVTMNNYLYVGEMLRNSNIINLPQNQNMKNRIENTLDLIVQHYPEYQNTYNNIREFL